LFTHCTQRERERERESDRYYYYHAGAIMQRTQTAGSNRSWDWLYCGTLAAALTLILLFVKMLKIPKNTFFNEPEFVKEIRESFRILNFLKFRTGIFKINELIIQWTWC
jgi:hypothetical protein